MLKKLLGRHRAVQIGVTLWARRRWPWFRQPAFAAQSVNNGNADNANAQNYFVVQGGSQAAYGALVAEADLFNSAPGCDLVGITGTTAATAQPLDYGCPGLGTESGTTEAGTLKPAASVATYTVDVSAAGLKNLTLQSGSVPFTGLAPGDLVTDSGGVVPTETRSSRRSRTASSSCSSRPRAPTRRTHSRSTTAPSRVRTATRSGEHRTPSTTWLSKSSLTAGATASPSSRARAAPPTGCPVHRQPRQQHGCGGQRVSDRLGTFLVGTVRDQVVRQWR